MKRFSGEIKKISSEEAGMTKQNPLRLFELEKV
jgi:hypothetical protein